MRKLVKLFKHLKKLKKYHIFSKYFLHHSKISYIEKSGKNLIKPKTITDKKTSLWDNIEFALFCSGVGLALYYIHLNKKHLSETTRLVAAGIATHLVVDIITYLGDKLNTKIKVDSFYKKKDLALKDVNYFFDKKFSHFKNNKQVNRKRNLGQKTLGIYLGDFHFRGLQAAMVFVTINSIVFFGLYKNVKSFLKEKFGLEGFSNFFLSAAFAQFFAMVLAFPLENIKTRMQASNFHYDSFYKYYKKLIKGKPWPTIYANFKHEYSGFVSHLVLYVVYESVTYAIYESLMKFQMLKNKNKEKDIDEIESIKSQELIDCKHDTHGENLHEINFNHVILASTISGLIAAIVTNPIDVYQINKQVNPKFHLSQLNRENILLGMKERIYFITFLNISTFIFLEWIGPKYYNVRLE